MPKLGCGMKLFRSLRHELRVVLARLVRMAYLTGVAFFLPACAHAAPVAMMNCVGHIAASHIVYRFAVKNNVQKSIAAIRVNYLGLAEKQRGLSFSPDHPAITYDYKHDIPAEGSALIEVQTTGLPRTTSPLHTGAVPCSALAIRYSDGSIWSTAPGIAAP